MSALDGEKRAGGQSHQIIGVRQYRGFIEIVDAPDQGAFCVPPCVEIFNMKITYAQDMVVAQALLAADQPAG